MHRRMHHHHHHHHEGPHCCPPQMCPTQFEQPHFCPPEEYVRTNYIHTVVPHVQPAHITTVNKHIIDHQYHFPCTECVVEECCETHTLCEMPPEPCHMPHHHMGHHHMDHHHMGHHHMGHHHHHMDHHMCHHMGHHMGHHHMGY
ncbi:CotD family spore coat protein [Lysinibacillus xylanilyticus]|uniref:CotD family spore coat protein n=1 Tax=Lysinibacillus xylanilyticus TaxID=582475 RepID=UPI003828B33F